MGENMQRVDSPDSQFRCQSVTQHGQCWMRAVPGSKFCPAHGGTAALRKAEREEKRIYLLTQFQDRVHAHEDHSEIKGLRAEIAIARMLLEKTLNLCTNEMDLMHRSSQLGQNLELINRLVTNCHKLELSMGGMIDGAQAVAWVQQIARIIDNHIDDSETKNRIIEDMMQSYEELTNDVVT